MHKELFLLIEMKKYQWKGVAGSIILHAILVGLLYFNTVRLSPPSMTSQAVEIALVSNNSNIEPSIYLSELAASNSTVPEANEKASTSLHSDADQDDFSSYRQEKLVLPPKEAPYFPSSQTDVKPRPINPVIVPFPDGVLDRPKGTAILVLFISAEGVVEHIEIDKSQLPQIFEQAAIDAFMQATMYPAIKNGNKVKSRMKVLVEFEENSSPLN